MNLSALVSKEFQRISADKRTLVLLFLIPALVLVIFGLSSGGGPTTFLNVNIITRDSEILGAANSSAFDESFINTVGNSTVFTVRRSVYNATDQASYDAYLAENKELIKKDVIDAVIIIPINFSEIIDQENDTLILKAFLDGSDAQVKDSFHVAIQEPISTFRITEGLTENLTVVIPYLEFDVPFWASQILNYSFPIIISMIMLGTCMNLTSLSIVSEQPLGRMLLAPSGKTSVIFSKFIAATSIMLLQSSEIFVIASLFGLFSRGPLFSVYVSLIVIGLVGICIGLFISAISKTEQVANQTYLMFFIMFTLFCQNFLPIDQMPPFFQAITNIFPLSHAIPLLSDIMYKGAALNPQAGFILLTTALIFYLAALIAYAFKKVEA